MELHDRGIRQDVRELGELLGEVIEARESRAAFETVERLRTGAIDYRRGEADSRADLRDALDGLDADRASVVARAFTTYFELINLAEERERVRAIRRASQEGSIEHGLEEAVAALAGSDRETVERVLDDVLVEPTFTAHPTEARRKTVKAKLRSVADTLERLDERSHTDKERRHVERDLAAEVETLWETRQIRERAPEPTDEARNVRWYLENTLIDVVGEVYDEFEAALSAELDEPVEVPELVGFRTWAGSDRDGNPYVTPDVTAETLAAQRAAALDRYRDDLERLSGALSHDGDRTDLGEAFVGSLSADRERLPGVADRVEDRYRGEPYRQKVELMRERLDRVGDVRPGGYADADELLADLDAIAESLSGDGGDTVVAAHLDPLRRTVETFGFDLASMDLRDHRENHTEAVGAALAREGIDYLDRDEAGRQALLTEAILDEDPVIDVTNTTDLGETPTRVLDRFAALSDWHREYGAQAVDVYCISMTEEPSHVLEVLFLADQAGVVDLPDYCGIDVVPLLETESALSGARRIVGTLFENEAYRAALSARGDTQEVMLGYSDSNKENGFVAANWSLYRNQRRLARIAEDYDVTVTLFHGRGGSISRGGGPMNEALLALPRDAVAGPVRFTEQGEAISEKYGNPRIAERNVEQMLNAQVRARHEALTEGDPEVPEEWVEAMETIAGAAREAYRDLVETEGFVEYFETATPITVIEDLNLGSRPASRTGERTVEDLRTIPWVFSWTQCRCIITGWFAFGTGVDAYLDAGGDLDTLREMYDEWRFFRTTLENMALALARTDLEIAAEYADAAPPDLRDHFFPLLSDEYDRSVDHLASITGRDRLVARDWLADSLERRNPYVDPLNLLQARLLDLSHRTDTEERVLRLTVKGIAAGMKNTG
ncbi:phosphoenolpyruvate carboxylase [Halobacteriales archaeon QS_8_69_26]|nr:MAG: phosphoenolpyruvate carboxylase [Halobacteriales archaeon QS_8_69_26]